MFNFIKKKIQGKKIVFNIIGMHCVSCAINIDGDLEDLDGVLEARTSYATAKTEIIFDPSKVTKDKLKKVIEALDYKVVEVT